MDIEKKQTANIFSVEASDLWGVNRLGHFERRDGKLYPLDEQVLKVFSNAIEEIINDRKTRPRERTLRSRAVFRSFFIRNIGQKS